MKQAFVPDGAVHRFNNRWSSGHLWSFAHGNPRQNRIPLLLIATSWLARDPTQNRIPLLLIALGC